jgi:DNA-binding XRE family transcriptional regulator
MNNKYLQLIQVSKMLEETSNLPQVPKKWWLYTIRTSLWMTRETAAKLAGVSSVAWLAAETREEKWTITIWTLQKFLKALSCTLEYSPKPSETLEAMVKKRALAYSRKKMGNIVSTMSLEDQNPWKSLAEMASETEAENIFRSGNWKEIWQ